MVVILLFALTACLHLPAPSGYRRDATVPPNGCEEVSFRPVRMRGDIVAQVVGRDRVEYAWTRRGALMGDDLMHECIHVVQVREVGGIWPWRAVYACDWLRGLSYRRVRFEQEAYSNEADHGYLTTREPLAWQDYTVRP